MCSGCILPVSLLISPPSLYLFDSVPQLSSSSSPSHLASLLQSAVLLFSAAKWRHFYTDPSCFSTPFYFYFSFYSAAPFPHFLELKSCFWLCEGRPSPPHMSSSETKNTSNKKIEYDLKRAVEKVPPCKYEY